MGWNKTIFQIQNNIIVVTSQSHYIYNLHGGFHVTILLTYMFLQNYINHNVLNLSFMFIWCTRCTLIQDISLETIDYHLFLIKRMQENLISAILCSMYSSQFTEYSFEFFVPIPVLRQDYLHRNKSFVFVCEAQNSNPLRIPLELLGYLRILL